MPRSKSLTRADFAKTKGFRRLVGAFVSVGYGIIPHQSTGKGAVVVSKKVAKSAVDRNRIKRTLRMLLVRFLTDGGPSIVVTIRKNAPSRDLRADLETVLAKILRS